MKDFKIIVEEEKEEFENKIREYLNLGYEIKNSNLSIALDNIQRLTNLGANKIKEKYYAYMEKEI